MTRDLNTVRSQLEIFLGHDNIARVNVDGTCALRVRLETGSQIAVRFGETEAVFTVPEENQNERANEQVR